MEEFAELTVSCGQYIIGPRLIPMEVSAPFGQKWASLGVEVMLQFGHADPREAGSSGQKFGHGRRLATTFGHSSDIDSGREGHSARYVCDRWEGMKNEFLN